MGDGTRKNPYTREDVLKRIEENGGKAKGLGAFEAFVGVFMMALFLVTFTKKMTR